MYCAWDQGCHLEFVAQGVYRPLLTTTEADEKRVPEGQPGQQFRGGASTVPDGACALHSQ